jgi:hypothetical protein
LSSNKCPAQRKKNSKGLSKAQGSWFELLKSLQIPNG